MPKDDFKLVKTGFFDSLNKAWVDNPLPRRELEIEP